MRATHALAAFLSLVSLTASQYAPYYTTAEIRNETAFNALARLGNENLRAYINSSKGYTNSTCTFESAGKRMEW